MQKTFICVSYLWSDGPWRQAGVPAAYSLVLVSLVTCSGLHPFGLWPSPAYRVTLHAGLSSTYLKLDRIKNKLNKRSFLWRFEPVTLNKDMDDMERLSWTVGQNDRLTTEWRMNDEWMTGDWLQRPLPERTTCILWESPRASASKSFREAAEFLCEHREAAEFWKSFEKLRTFDQTPADALDCHFRTPPAGWPVGSCGILWKVMLLHVASQHRKVFLPRSTGLSCISTLTLRMRCGKCMVNVVICTVITCDNTVTTKGTEDLWALTADSTVPPREVVQQCLGREYLADWSTWQGWWQVRHFCGNCVTLVRQVIESTW